MIGLTARLEQLRQAFKLIPCFLLKLLNWFSTLGDYVHYFLYTIVRNDFVEVTSMQTAYKTELPNLYPPPFFFQILKIYHGTADTYFKKISTSLIPVAKTRNSSKIHTKYLGHCLWFLEGRDLAFKYTYFKTVCSRYCMQLLYILSCLFHTHFESPALIFFSLKIWPCYRSKEEVEVSASTIQST